MILKIKKVSTRVAILHNVPKKFFMELETATKFGEHLFPEWFNSVFNTTTLNKKFEDVYISYKAIRNERDRLQVIKAFENSNQIDKLCSNDPDIELITIKDLPVSIQEPIENLFSYLYNSATKYPPFTAYVNKTISQSIDSFIQYHNIEVCPICGLEGFLNLDGQARLALDHWLCQDIFPFSSVNFNNLIPIGDKCNSRPAKGNVNILINKVSQNRAIAFYPYRDYQGVYARFTFIEEPSFENEDGNWEFIIAPKDKNEVEYFESWNETFNINTRYRSFVKNNILTMWQNSYIEFIDNHDLLEHATDLEEFKRNLLNWKGSYMKKKYPGYKAYRSFINHLLQDVSDAYLHGVYQNILRNKTSI